MLSLFSVCVCMCVCVCVCVCVCGITSQTPLSMTFHFSLWQFNQSSTTLMQASLVLTSSLPPVHPFRSCPSHFHKSASICLSLSLHQLSIHLYVCTDGLKAASLHYIYWMLSPVSQQRSQEEHQTQETSQSEIISSHKMRRRFMVCDPPCYYKSPQCSKAAENRSTQVIKQKDRLIALLTEWE